MNRDEELLFSTPATHDSIDDLWQEYFDDNKTFETTESEYESDDDLFNTRLEETPGSGQLLSSPLLTSVDASTILPDDRCLQDIDTYSKCDAGTVSKSQSRDRWRSQTRRSENALTAEQVLGHL